MATMRDVVISGIRQTGLLPLGQAPNNAEVVDGLEALNDMMHGWKANGVDISHTTKTLLQTFPLADMHLSGVKALLAVKMCGVNGAEPSAATVLDAKAGWRALQAAYISAPENVQIDKGLTTTPGQRFANSDIINND